MKYVLKTFEELSNLELYEVLKLRSIVFVVEQNCPFLDQDDYDQEALHLLGFENNEIKAYSRISPPGYYYKETSIGRVVTAKGIRMTGAGKLLFKKSMEEIKRLFPKDDVRIMAQCYLKKFYSDFGFKEVGEEFLEDGIPHIEMLYSFE